MPEFLLDRDGDAPLAFAGEVVAEAWSGHTDVDLRHHDLRLYRTRGGQYVLETVFVSRHRGEGARRTAVICGDAAAVRAAVRAHPTCPPGVGYPPGPAYEDRQRRMAADLAARYARAVTELFAPLGPEFAERID